MCGVVGTTDPYWDVAAAVDQIRHRGPDADGVTTMQGVTHGHCRLAIRDLTGSAQPFTHGDTVLSYNGEVWDVPGQSDTAHVAAALDADGTSALPALDGQWAMAWTDSRTGRTYLARDRFGEVTLYVERTAGGWRWASEQRALGPGARPLPPGSFMCVTDPDARPVRWAPPPAAAAPFTHPDEVAAAVDRAVSRRLVADVPVALLLSGGLDSTLIAATAAPQLDRAVAYTAVLDEDSPDLWHAREAAADLGVKLVEVPVPEVTLDTIADAVACVEAPLKAQVEIALACLPLARQIADDGFRVVLSGELADEAFGGYGNLKRHATDDVRWQDVRAAAVDRCSRGNFVRLSKVFLSAGVEARTPFADPQLVSRALATGLDHCPPGKTLLQAAAAGRVPDYIIRRPKLTFQGASGTAAAAQAACGAGVNPVKVYNQMARAQFGHLPKG